jgi:RHS repeat-associated protein
VVGDQSRSLTTEGEASRWPPRGGRRLTALHIVGLVASGYDPDGRLLATDVTRQGGTIEATTYGYDASGRMATRTRPGSLQESFTYNSDDTLATWTTRLANTQGKQLVIADSYDPANRLISRGPANSQDFDDAHRPQGLAPLDGGDIMTYDALGRMTSSGVLPQPSVPTPDPLSLVTYSNFDTRGLPETERVGGWPQGSAIERHYDAFGNTIATLLPQGIAAGADFAGQAASYDALDRMTSVTQANPDGTPIPGAPFGATLGWSGTARPTGVATPAGLTTAQGFDPTTGRMTSLTVSQGSATLGQLQYGWDVPHDLKLGRQVAPAPSALTPQPLFTGQGYAASYDAVSRMRGAETGQGNTAGGSTQGPPLGGWTYGYGKADELLSITDAAGGIEQYTSGPEGRITSRTGPDATSETFTYDGEGRRIEDAENAYTWDWRGRLASIEVKDVGAELASARNPYAGERLTYAYDATGRLLSRTELGTIPQGGTDADRPFIAKRAFTWDGQRLAAEAGLNFQDVPIWREQYAPGERGLDDAPLVRVEKDLQGTPTIKTYALLRDEMGSVMAVAEERAGQSPNLLARYLYAPYGQVHTELGPELVKIEFDPTVTNVAATPQTPTANETVGGALRIVTTSPLAPTSLTTGLAIEQWNAATSSWETAPRSDFAIGLPGSELGDGTIFYVMRIAGWEKAAKYRITLLPSLTDVFGRAIVLPSSESQGVRVDLDVPSDGTTEPTYARAFPVNYSKANDEALGGAFPGGQTAGFQGAWSDPVTGLGYHRARWFDRSNAAWLDADPLGPAESRNYYAAIAWKPTLQQDPSGEFSCSMFGVGEPVHEAITLEASSQVGLSGFLPGELARTHGRIDSLYASEDAQHFDNNEFAAGVALVQRFRNGARSERDPVEATWQLGRLLHAVEDFYSHSNYVEIRTLVTHPGIRSADLPLWDFVWPPTEERLKPAACPYPPNQAQQYTYALEGCGLHSGSFSTGMYLRRGAGESESWAPLPVPWHYGLYGINKDEAATKEGRKLVPLTGETFFEVARVLAVRQTAAELRRVGAERLRWMEEYWRRNYQALYERMEKR